MSHFNIKKVEQRLKEMSGKGSLETAAPKKAPAKKAPAKKAPAKTAKKEPEKSIRLSVFADEQAIKLAQKLYFGYVSHTDMSGFLEFVLALDSFIVEERKGIRDPVDMHPEEEEDEDEEEDVDLSKRARNLGNKGDNDDDEDEEISIKIPKAAHKLVEKLTASVQKQEREKEYFKNSLAMEVSKAGLSKSAKAKMMKQIRPNKKLYEIASSLEFNPFLKIISGDKNVIRVHANVSERKTTEALKDILGEVFQSKVSYSKNKEGGYKFRVRGGIVTLSRTIGTKVVSLTFSK